MCSVYFRNVVLYFVFVSFVFVINGKMFFATKRDPIHQFRDYTIIKPKIVPHVREKRHLLNSAKVRNEEKLTVAFEAFNQQVFLDLKMNKHLLPSNYFEKHHEKGSYVTHLPMSEDSSHCHYQGHVRGIKNSFAAISTCDGISGIVYNGKDIQYIQPDHQSAKEKHFLFLSSDLVPQNLSCGYKKLENFPFQPHLKESTREKRSIVSEDPYKSNEESRYVELIIVNDNKQFLELNKDKKAVFERSKQIANIVNGLYQPLNIFIALVGVIIWSDYDEISLSSDGDATLTNFLHYRRERLSLEHPNDNAQLITAIVFDAGVVGKALKGPMCTHQYSGGVNMDYSKVVGIVASTVAHELGHNFGMEHDSGECQCPSEKCIMSPSSSSTVPRHWSSCSVEYLQLAYSHGMDHCLKRRPGNVLGPVCGNGFLEENEECDCGLSEFCESQCCNATTCRLYTNATCAMGSCCDMNTCKVKQASTVCRESASECDLPEYCDGESEFCPSNTFLQNGETCDRGKAYCYKGKCRSQTDQCKLLWGKTGKSADMKCYLQNFKGNLNGNCGYNRTHQTYKPCQREDVSCGMLHCTHLNEKLEFGMESAAIISKSYIQTQDNKTLICRSAIIDLGLSDSDPGLVPNGAKCGHEKVCFHQKCVSVNLIRKGCPHECNGRGVCNDKGNCHCNDGYAPPFCDSAGVGGSFDSGPASKETSNSALIYVLFFGLVPLIILLAIYYNRDYVKNWWSRKVHKASIRSRTRINSHPRAQLPAKFSSDKRGLKISAPVQNLSSSVQLPVQANSDLHTTVPVLCSQIVPVRPAPPRPRAALNNPSTVSATDSWKKTPSPSCVRPNSPPPHPPNRKGDFSKNSTNSGSATLSPYYDDCQSLLITKTTLPVVEPIYDDVAAESRINDNPPQRANLSKSKDSANAENSLVATLAQKFESAHNRTDYSVNPSLRPPFKSRPQTSNPNI